MVVLQDLAISSKRLAVQREGKGAARRLKKKKTPSIKERVEKQQLLGTNKKTMLAGI